MDARAVIEDGISRGRGVVERALDGLDDSDLAYRPSPEANPIGWMAWHIGRVEDMHMADLMGEEQLWTAAGFHEDGLRSGLDAAQALGAEIPWRSGQVAAADVPLAAE